MDWITTFIHFFNVLHDFIDEMLGIKPEYDTESDLDIDL